MMEGAVNKTKEEKATCTRTTTTKREKLTKLKTEKKKPNVLEEFKYF